jgi:hypothetical protein
MGLGIVLMSFDACAQPTLSAQYGVEIHGGVDRSEIGASFPTPLGGRLGPTALNVSVNADVAQWHATRNGEQHEHLMDFGITPQVRLLLPDHNRFQPYVDVGIGAHYLSGYYIDGHRLGQHFQFGDYIGIGARVGEERRLAVSLRLLHESNCGTTGDNSGLLLQAFASSTRCHDRLRTAHQAIASRAARDRRPPI